MDGGSRKYMGELFPGLQGEEVGTGGGAGEVISFGWEGQREHGCNQTRGPERRRWTPSPPFPLLRLQTPHPTLPHPNHSWLPVAQNRVPGSLGSQDESSLISCSLLPNYLSALSSLRNQLGQLTALI